MLPTSFERWMAPFGLFTGVALLINIVGNFSLRWAVALASAIVLVSFYFVYKNWGPKQRQAVHTVARIGLTGGLIATVFYDLARLTLSHIVGPHINPLEAVRVFGVLLAGQDASPLARWSAGIAFHLANGSLFGMAFCALFGRRGVLAGVAWGLFLEIFQLALYPGWLNVRAYQEFLQLSALSHVIYGTVLGFYCLRNLPVR